MCIVCTKEYDQNTNVLHCCMEVTEIPLLPNLTRLNCSYTEVAEIPLLLNLTELYCHHTNVTEIPLLPNLTELYCSNTKVTEIPVLPNLTEIYCSYTKVTVIPLFPKLAFLNCRNTEIKYISDIYININIYSNNEIIYYNDYQLRKLQKNHRKRQFLKIIDMLPMHTNISKYLVLPEMLK